MVNLRTTLLICFCSFNLSYPILEKEHFMDNLYINCIVLSYKRAFFFLTMFFSIDFSRFSSREMKYREISIR